MRKFLKLTCATVISALATSPALADGHAQSWDMPMAYSATNFHSEQGVMFADKVREYTKGAIDITDHPGGSLFGGGDIANRCIEPDIPIMARRIRNFKTKIRRWT